MGHLHAQTLISLSNTLAAGPCWLDGLASGCVGKKLAGAEWGDAVQKVGCWEGSGYATGRRA